MKIFFVLDIKGKRAVLAEKGEREKYEPLSEKSLVARTDDPIEVVKMLEPRFLYVADLDRISGKGENMGTVEALSKMVEDLIADCGFRKAEELRKISFKPVVGTETFDITEIDRKCYVSLDFRDSFLDASRKFRNWKDAIEFLNCLELYGIIVLNLRRVGSLNPDFELLSRVLEISENPVLLGGGVGSFSDLERLKDIGCDGVLIATAIHKKLLPLEIIQKGFI
uniref:HisA/HisF family protein n=1 Tax=Archaeoglobus fulgidus TaxID=2234 RepID=A0A7J2THV2_ARCFL